MQVIAKWNNTIYFENGIMHQLDEDEINVIRKGLLAIEPTNEQEKEALEELKSLFLEHLD